MAAYAALGLHRHVFVYEWAALVRVAFHAIFIAADPSANLPQRVRPMHVVAVTALHQPFFNAVVVRLGKVGFGRGVATEAEF
jgi:hypothetical protein